jgi:hypothetical protein
MRRGHEGSRLLMTRQNKLDTRATQGFDDVEVLFAWHGKDAINTFVFQGLHEQVGCFHD